MKSRFIILSLIIAIASCSKEEPLRERPYAVIETQPNLITRTSSIYGKIEFRGKIESAPDEILDYGFKWSASDPSLPGYIHNEISFGPLVRGTGKSFSHTMSIQIPYNQGFMYTVRAYARTENHISYGEPQYFCCPL